MSEKNLYRFGGIAAIVGTLLTFGTEAAPILLGLGVLVLAGFYFALYRLNGSQLNLIALVSTLVGAVAFLIVGVNPSALFNVLLILAMWLPALLAGLAAKQSDDFPRIWPYFGIAAGLLGMLNALVNISGGGNYESLTSPLLKTLSELTYFPATLAALVWWIWGGVIMLRKK